MIREEEIRLKAFYDQREKEITKAAEEFAFSNKTETSNHHDAINDFYYGAKWADENQPGMSKMRKDYELLFLLKKQELIKKACEWLEKNKDNYIIDIEGETIVDCSIIKDLRKTMEK